MPGKPTRLWSLRPRKARVRIRETKEWTMAQLEQILDYDTAVELITNEIDIEDYERAQELYDYYVNKGQVGLGDEPWGVILAALEDDLFELIE
jgi:hypothetical protein